MYTYLLMLVVLFFPSKYFIEYHIVLIFLLGTAFIYGSAKNNKFSIENNILLKIIALLIVWVAVDSILVSIYFHNDYYRNLSEIIRFIPLLLLLMNLKYFSLNKKYVNISLFVYAIVAFVVSYLQFNDVYVVDLVTGVYSSPNHIELSLGLSRRALGLSTGPGNNAAILVVIYSYFLALFFSEINYKTILISVISLVILSVSILLSQSQTGFIALCFLTIYAIVFNLIFPFGKYSRKRGVYFSFFMITITIPIIFQYWNDLKYLLSLFDSGLERHSYRRREEKISSTIELILNGPIFFFFIGYGKDYIPSSNALDNEYVFLLGVYGVFVFLVIILLYLVVLFMSWFLRGNSNADLLILHFVIVSGIILSWPSSFLLDPRILMLLFVFISIYLCNVKIRMKE